MNRQGLEPKYAVKPGLTADWPFGYGWLIPTTMSPITNATPKMRANAFWSEITANEAGYHLNPTACRNARASIICPMWLGCARSKAIVAE